MGVVFADLSVCRGWWSSSRIGPLRTPGFAKFLGFVAFPSLVGHFLRFGRARGACWSVWPFESLYAAKVCLVLLPPLSGGSTSQGAMILLGMCSRGIAGRTPSVHPFVPGNCRVVAGAGGVPGFCRDPF